MSEEQEVYVPFSPALFRTLFSNVERRASEMDIEEIRKIKSRSKLICELAEMVEELIEKLNQQDTTLRKEKQYYMDEYKKVSDALHKLRSEISFKDVEKDLFPERLVCENEKCTHNVRGSCQSEKITIGVDGGTYCKMSEDKTSNNLPIFHKSK